MRVMHPGMAIDDNFIVAGPLNLNKRMMRADTVMGERLQLSHQQFRTLLMLVSNEGVSIPFEELHMSMTMPDEEKCSTQEARDVIITLINIVNISGRGFAKINMLPNDEYAFVTKWGMDWRSVKEVAKTQLNSEPEKAVIGKSDKFSKMVLSVSTIAVLAVFIGSYFMFLSNDDGLAHIPMVQIPLAGMQFNGEPITFPYVRGDVFNVDASRNMYIDTRNTYSGDVIFMLCLQLSEARTPLSWSILIPRGEAANSVLLSESIEPGRYEAEFVLRAFCARYLTEVDNMIKQVVIYIW